MIARRPTSPGAPLLRREFTLDSRPRRRRPTPSLSRHRARRLRGLPRRPAGQRRRAQPGWSQLRVAAALPQLRRHRPAAADRTAWSCSASRSGNGWFRGRLGWTGGRALYGDELGAARRAGDHVRRRSRADRRHRRVVAGRPVGGRSPTTSTTARRSTRGCATTPGCSPGRRDGLDRRARRRRSTPPALTPYLGPPVRRQETVRPVADLDLAGRADARRLRPEPRRLGALHRAPGRAGATITMRHAEVLEDGELGHPAAAHRAGDRPVHPQRRRRHLRADADLPRLPLRRGRRLAGRADPGRPRWPSSSHSDLRADRHVRVLRRAAQPAAPQRRLGDARQLPRRPDRLPAARRAARLDRRPRRVRADRRFPVRRRAASSATGCATSPPSSGPPTDGSPFVVPDVLKYVDPRRRSRRRRRTAIWSDAAVWVPWALWQAYGDRAVLARALRRRWPRTSAASRRSLSPNGLWDTGFQFGDWLDPTAPPDKPFLAAGRQRRRRHRLPLPQRTGWSPRRRRCSAADADAEDSRALRSACGRRSASTTSIRRRHRAQRLRDRLRARHRVRPARRAAAGSGPATASPSSSRRTATGSPPGSPARRSSPTR